MDYYQASVDELFVPYIFPSENGGRGEVRWLTLADDKGYGIKITGQPPLQISASRFSLENLTAARHTVDLIADECVYLRLDAVHMGICGDDSWSPGVQFSVHLSIT